MWPESGAAVQTCASLGGLEGVVLRFGGLERWGTLKGAHEWPAARAEECPRSSVSGHWSAGQRLCTGGWPGLGWAGQQAHIARAHAPCCAKLHGVRRWGKGGPRRWRQLGEGEGVEGEGEGEARCPACRCTCECECAWAVQRGSVRVSRVLRWRLCVGVRWIVCE